MAGITSILGASDFAIDYYDWCSKYVDLHQTPPCNKTIGRLLAALNPDSIEELMRLVSSRQLAEQSPPFKQGRPVRHLAADGKSVAGSVTKYEAQTAKEIGGRQALMTANILDVGTGLTVASAGTPDSTVMIKSVATGQVSTSATSEHGLLEQLLSVIDLRGAEISVDAAHARKAVTDIIDAVGSAKSGDRAYWTICIKGNQYASRELIREAFAPLGKRKIDSYTEVVSSRGDSRTTEVIKAMPRFEPDAELRKKWPRVASMIIVERTRSDRGSIARESAAEKKPIERTTFSYYLSSYPHSAKSAHDVIRKHWEVENGLHWILDVSYGEDASQLRERTAARNLAIMRRIAKNLLTQKGTSKGGVRDQRRFAASEEFRDHIFGK